MGRQEFIFGIRLNDGREVEFKIRENENVIEKVDVFAEEFGLLEEEKTALVEVVVGGSDGSRSGYQDNRFSGEGGRDGREEGDLVENEDEREAGTANARNRLNLFSESADEEIDDDIHIENEKHEHSNQNQDDYESEHNENQRGRHFPLVDFKTPEKKQPKPSPFDLFREELEYERHLSQAPSSQPQPKASPKPQALSTSQTETIRKLPLQTQPSSSQQDIDFSAILTAAKRNFLESSELSWSHDRQENSNDQLRSSSGVEALNEVKDLECSSDLKEESGFKDPRGLSVIKSQGILTQLNEDVSEISEGDVTIAHKYEQWMSKIRENGNQKIKKREELETIRGKAKPHPVDLKAHQKVAAKCIPKAPEPTPSSKSIDSKVYDRLVAKQKASELRIAELKRLKDVQDSKESTFHPQISKPALASPPDPSPHPSIHSRLFYDGLENKERSQAQNEAKFRELHPFQPQLPHQKSPISSHSPPAYVRLHTRSLTSQPRNQNQTPTGPSPPAELRPAHQPTAFSPEDLQSPSPPPPQALPFRSIHRVPSRRASIKAHSHIRPPL